MEGIATNLVTSLACFLLVLQDDSEDCRRLSAEEVVLIIRIRIRPRAQAQRLTIFHLILGGRRKSSIRKPDSPSKGAEVLEIAVGTSFILTRFSLVRISI